MKIETLPVLDTYIHDSRVWNYPACYMVDGIDQEIFDELLVLTRFGFIPRQDDEVLVSVPLLCRWIDFDFEPERDYKVDDKTKDYLTDIYNGIDSSEGYIIFRL